MNKPLISFCFPAYNEEDNIVRVVEKAKAELEVFASKFEIIIVNDGSHDATGTIIDKMAAEDSRILAFHHSQNRGYGAALKTAFSKATNEYIFYMDSDDQFDIKEIAHFIPFLNDYDIVTGYRIIRNDSIIRNFNANGWRMVNKILFGISVRDINCAFKCIHKSVFDKISLTSDGAMINAELYAKARQLGLTIKEVGVSHYPRTAGQQTGANLKVIIRAFRELFVLKRKMIKSHYSSN